MRNTKWIDFGYRVEGNKGITRDGEILAALGFTVQELEDERANGSEDSDAIWNKFVEAGGDDSHSVYSWGYVRNVAAVLVNHGWKTVDDIPEDSSLYKQVRTETPQLDPKLAGLFQRIANRGDDV